MPKGKRRFIQRKRSSSAPAVLSSRKPSKRKCWSEDQMAAAMTAVKGGCKTKRAAEEHGVPVSTLRDRISGRVIHGTKPGPRPYLSSTEETELSSFLKSCSDIGYGRTRTDVMGIARSVAAEKGVLKGEKVTQGWWRRFCERQPDISLRRGDPTAHIRMDAINSNTIRQYFTLLNDVLTKHDLHSKPAQIYNVDESGIPFDPRAPNVVATRETKKVRYRSSGKKGQVTAVGCASAAGHAIPPMVIFNAKRLNPEWTKGEFPGTTYGLSDNGWVNSELFEAWLSEHFLQHAVSARPLLLLLDGHSTHYQPQLLRVAKENDVIMLCLPPHTTHEAQPLDCGVFGPLKTHWSHVCHAYLQQNPGRLITRFQFSTLFSQAWSAAVSPANVIAGFRTCGVYPFNPSAICVSACNTDYEDGTGASTPVLSSSDDLLHQESPYDSAEEECQQNSAERDMASGVGAFTDEQECRFHIRHEEGFNVFTDKDYVRWLKIHHPESLPHSTPHDVTLAEHFSSVMPAVEIPVNPSLTVSPGTENSPSTSRLPSTVSPTTENSPSTSRLLSTVSPTTEKSPSIIRLPSAVSPNTENSPSIIRLPSTVSPTTENSPSTSCLPSTVSPTTENSPSIIRLPSTVSSTAENSPSTSRLPSTVSPTTERLSSTITSAPIHKKGVGPSYVSKYLMLPQVNTPTPSPKTFPRARLLTSADAMAQIEEERKKKLALEEKERRKVEREEKRRQKEMEQKQKAEERLKKMELRAKKANEAAKKRCSRRVTEKTAVGDSTREGSCSEPPRKKTRKGKHVAVSDTEIDTNVCCVCFGLYTEDVSGADWIECACGQHEECAEECVVDANGKERFCPACL